MTDLATLLDLLKFREVSLFEKLMKTSQSLKMTGKTSYEVLMHETSDIMQDLAFAYGERETLEYCMQRLASLQSVKNKEVMEQVFQLFALDIIERDLTHYIIAGVLSKEAAASISPSKIVLVKILADISDDLLDCMSIPKHALYAPIAGDYVKYNASPNFGEIVGAKL